MAARKVEDPIAQARAVCRAKFLRVFPKGFRDAKYLAWERDYKWDAHELWESTLGEQEYARLLAAKGYAVIVQRAMAVESRTNLLFSFEKMALRDAVRTPEGARTFALALHTWLRSEARETDFERFVEAVDHLPRKQTRVLTWPLITVFGFIAQPHRHLFLKPQVTKVAAAAYQRPFPYRSRPNWETYEDLLDFAEQLKTDLSDLKPRDLIDIQSFIFMLGWHGYA